jgi:hypothetical protein
MINKVKITLIAALATVFSLQAQELPAPSPYGEVMQRVGLTDVKVEYSRPGVKEREIFGGLLEWGKVWRTGANASTKISFSSNVYIGGKELKAGTYSVFTELNKGEWAVMLNSDVDASEGSFSKEKNVASIAVKASEVKKSVETLTFTFANVTESSADWKFEWANMTWSIPIKVEVDEMAMENIKTKISEVENSYGVYNSAARYYLEHDKDLKQALEWSQKSVKMSAKFWNVITLSKIYAAMGDYKKAIETAEQSMELAEKAEYTPYIIMNKENIEKWSKKK